MTSKSVILCDDDKTLTDIVRIVLIRKNFRVYTAADGAAAMKLLRSSSPDLLFLDIDMPGMNGFQVLETMRAEKLHAPYTIVISGHEDKASRERASALGAAEVWVKPFNAAKLLASVEELIKQGKV